MKDLFVSFKDSDTAVSAREAINKAASGLPATQGILGGGSSLRLRGDELAKENTENLDYIGSIIHLFGGIID